MKSNMSRAGFTSTSNTLAFGGHHTTVALLAEQLQPMEHAAGGGTSAAKHVY